MKAKIWNELYTLPTGSPPKLVYASKQQCKRLALKQDATIEFNYYGRRKHKLISSSGGCMLCEGYDELLSDLELI